VGRLGQIFSGQVFLTDAGHIFITSHESEHILEKPQQAQAPPSAFFLFHVSSQIRCFTIRSWQLIMTNQHSEMDIPLISFYLQAMLMDAERIGI
jgi:hypothetical protein